MIPLVVGALIASLALAFVLYPLFDESAEARAAAARPRRPVGPALATPDAIAALREIEFDRATGKLSDVDYEALKATYTRQALAEMRAGQGGAADVVAPAAAVALADDPLEALIRSQRERLVTCSVHGPRPESDALFCSDCGRFLEPACGRCGAAVTQADARFCTECGVVLAA